MNAFAAIILICRVSVSPAECDEANAISVMSRQVSSELACATGWQEVIARSSLKDGLGSDTYLKTLCRRVRRERDE